MSNVTIIKGDLFTAPKGSIICHACNCYGVWGSGIARQFKERYPEAYKVYYNYCKEMGTEARGSCLLIPARDLVIGCLFTSVGFGGRVDPEEVILDATHDAVNDLIFQNTYPDAKPIAMCKINAGLFGVPWPKTQAVLEKFKSTSFTVYEV